ncbi:MAG: lysine--tRNA ligase [bacterium]|nr:lysine--tRNA ligase [bacterium]
MSRLEEERQNRLKKLNDLIESGINPYPASSKRSHTIHQVIGNIKNFLDSKKDLILVGRIISLRLHGKSTFLNIEDGTGSLQIFVKKDEVGSNDYELFKNNFDLGDFINVSGKLFTTKKGETTLLVNNISILSKALLPLPEKWHGLTDVEIRYRKRYLDLIANKEVNDIFRKRSVIIKTIRDFMDQEGALEVETPVLQLIPGGANARPFITHHNALDTDFYLRIAPELYLKRLIVGGIEKVYEISRCFRNEGIDKNHNPEFTQVEFYAAYWDYKKMMKFTEELLEKVVLNIQGKLTFEYNNIEIDFTPPYQVITFYDAFLKYTNINLNIIKDEELFKEAKKLKLEISKKDNKAKILDEIFKELVRPNLIKPTFIIDHPVELSPLAKKKVEDKKYVERFQLVVAGTVELCNAFSELNNPIDQLERFKNQEDMRKQGDEEAQRIDQDFITALEHGMPPTAGIGIGIDRLVALLTNSPNLKEVIIFPTLKPKNDEK